MAPLLLFDIDMTLVRTEGAGRWAIGRAFQKLWGLENAFEGIQFDGRTDHAIFTEAIGLHHLADGDLEGAYQRAVEAYLEELPRSMADRAGSILPGVVELLDAVERLDIPIGLATGNMRRGAAIKLGYFDLWRRFQAGGFGDNTPVRAEVVAEAILEAATLAGVDPHPANCIVIGDTPLDVEAAHLAGARAMAVATGRHNVDDLRASGAEYAVPDLADTEAVLEMLLR